MTHTRLLDHGQRGTDSAQSSGSDSADRRINAWAEANWPASVDRPLQPHRLTEPGLCTLTTPSCVQSKKKRLLEPSLLGLPLPPRASVSPYSPLQRAGRRNVPEPAGAVPSRRVHIGRPRSRRVGRRVAFPRTRASAGRPGKKQHRLSLSLCAACCCLRGSVKSCRVVVRAVREQIKRASPTPKNYYYMYF
jgi:hypothetical protein